MSSPTSPLTTCSHDAARNHAMADLPPLAGDHEPLDLTAAYNTPTSLLEDPGDVELGSRLLHGLPFRFADARAAMTLLVLDKSDGNHAVTVAVNAPVKWLIFAHAVLEADLYDGLSRAATLLVKTWHIIMMCGGGLMAHTSPVYAAVGDRYDPFDRDVADQMMQIIEGACLYILKRARTIWPGTAAHRHGWQDHVEFLLGPIEEALLAVRRRIEAHA